MFDLLKKKLSGWLKKSTDKVKKIVGTEEKIVGKEKKSKKSKIKKPVKVKKSKEQLKQERETTEKIVEDIKKEKIEITSPEERFEELEQKKQEKKGFFARLKEKFIGKFKISEEYFNDIFSELEMVLLENNVALDAVEFLREKLKKDLVGKEIEKNKVEKEISSSLKSAIEEMLKEPFNLIEKIKEKEGTYVVVLFGINGSGKTTTIAKLARLLQKNKLSVVLAAADTFRAASIEQLQEHGKRLRIEVIKSQYNADPASVAFDAIKHAQSRKINVVLIDTAGRMHTKDSLMKEMEKIVRVSKPDLKIFIGESVTGNDATEQARTFNESIGIDGIILSKADVDEKGGTALSVSQITGKPILYLGTGQNYDDLELFSKKKIIESLGL